MIHKTRPFTWTEGTVVWFWAFRHTWMGEVRYDLREWTVGVGVYLGSVWSVRLFLLCWQISIGRY